MKNGGSGPAGTGVFEGFVKVFDEPMFGSKVFRRVWYKMVENL